MPRRDAGRPRGAAVTRAIVDAALAELATGGPAGLSMERVARRADVHKTTVYRRFPRKEDLVAACLERVLSQSAQLPPTGSVRGDLSQLAAFVADLLTSDAGRALFRATLAEEAAPAVAALAHRALAGERAPEGSETARRAVFVLVGAVIHRVFLERADPDKTWRHGVVDLLVDGLGGEASPHETQLPRPTP